jgi:hypothetical protein
MHSGPDPSRSLSRQEHGPCCDVQGGGVKDRQLGIHHGVWEFAPGGGHLDYECPLQDLYMSLMRRTWQQTTTSGPAWMSPEPTSSTRVSRSQERASSESEAQGLRCDTWRPGLALPRRDNTMLRAGSERHYHCSYGAQ